MDAFFFFFSPPMLKDFYIRIDLFIMETSPTAFPFLTHPPTADPAFPSRLHLPLLLLLLLCSIIQAELIQLFLLKHLTRVPPLSNGLRLQRNAVDAISTEAFPHLVRHLHPPLHRPLPRQKMRRRDALALTQPPSVQLMHRLHALDLLQMVTEDIEIEVEGRCLEEDAAGGGDEGVGGEEDHEGDGEADGGVGVETRGGVGVGDDEGDDDNADVVDGVGDDVEEDAEHA